MRFSLIVIFLLVIISGCSEMDVKKKSVNYSELKTKLTEIITSSGAEVGIAVKDLETDSTLFINSEQMMHAASTMKVPVMIELFRQAEGGKFDLNDSLVVKNQFKSIVDGSDYAIEDDSDDLIYKQLGKKMSIRQLVFQMITVSSNLATNILIDMVDAKNVMSTLQLLGVKKMQVLRGVEDIKAYEKGLNNRTNAYDLMLVMESIVNEKAASTKSCQEMIDILSHQKFRGKIPAGVPKNIKVVNKTGSITRISHDAAIVFPENQKPYILVVLTKGLSDQKEAEKLIAELSKNVYENLVGKGDATLF